MPQKQRKLFCQINPFCYALSTYKEIAKRSLKNLTSKEHFARSRLPDRLPCLVYAHTIHMIRRAPGVNLQHQLNKAVNIDLAARRMDGLVLHPGESFSFWDRVGMVTRWKGYKEGRVIVQNHLTADIGGGLCNLSHALHLLVLHSPLEVTEFHSHSDALAPDEGPRVPFSAGTSICYNYLDFRFRNTTDQDVQLCVWCEGETLYTQLRSQRPFPWRYEIVEEDHHFRREGDSFYRVSKIYRKVADSATGALVRKDLVLDNHSKVMFDESLIPKELIRE